jgi:hypothetical protein
VVAHKDSMVEAGTDSMEEFLEEPITGTLVPSCILCNGSLRCSGFCGQSSCLFLR